MQLLADAVETYEETAIYRWWEWETASDGRRQLTWSTGTRDLRALAGLGREATDEEIAESELEGNQIAAIPRDVWVHLLETGRAPRLLQAAEQAGLDAAEAWISCCQLVLSNKSGKASNE